MPDKKISQLSSLTTPDSLDLFAIVDVSAGITKKITYADLLTSIGSVGGSGTENFVPKWADPNTLTDSSIFCDDDGHVGVGIDDPFSRFCNTDANVIASDGNGVCDGVNAFLWANTASGNGYPAIIFNGSDSEQANGLAVRIAGIASTNVLLDLSVGEDPSVGGDVIFKVLGNGNVGYGVDEPISRISNTDTDILSSDGFGMLDSENSILWSNLNPGVISQTGIGYMAMFYNGIPSISCHGLAVKIANDSEFNTILDLSVGESQDEAGTPIFRVLGDGKVEFGAGDTNWNPITGFHTTKDMTFGEDGGTPQGPVVIDDGGTPHYWRLGVDSSGNFDPVDLGPV